MENGSDSGVVAAAVYFDDMYADADFSLDTARSVANVQPWVTNEFEHDGLRQSPAVLPRLMQMVRDVGGLLAAR